MKRLMVVAACAGVLAAADRAQASTITLISLGEIAQSALVLGPSGLLTVSTGAAALPGVDAEDPADPIVDKVFTREAGDAAGSVTPEPGEVLATGILITCGDCTLPGADRPGTETAVLTLPPPARSGGVLLGELAPPTGAAGHVAVFGAEGGGLGAGESSTVPEPASLALLGVGLAVLARRLKTQRQN